MPEYTPHEVQEAWNQVTLTCRECCGRIKAGGRLECAAEDVPEINLVAPCENVRVADELLRGERDPASVTTEELRENMRKAKGEKASIEAPATPTDERV